MFKTDLYKNKLKVAGNDLDTISEKNKGIANIYRGISPQLGDIADAQIDNVVLDIDNDVLKFLQIQGAVNAQKGSAIIASFKEASKSKSETALRYSTAMASKEELKASVTNFEESKKMLNSYINSEPILGTKLNSPETNIVASPDGSIDKPYNYDDNFDKSLLREGDVIRASTDGEEQLFKFTSDGDFEVVITSTPDDIEYKSESFELTPSAESPSASQSESPLSRLASVERVEPGGIDIFSSPNLDFLRGSSSAEDTYGTGSGGLLTMGGSTREQVTAVRNAENNTKEIVKNLQKDYGMMTRGIPSSKRPPAEEASAKMNRDNLSLQEYVKDMYQLFLSSDENTKSGRTIKNRLKKSLQKIKRQERASYFNKETKSLLSTLEL